jgi:L-ribulose-5-phosphate 3-epimerase
MPHPLDRRDFLAASAGLAASTLLASNPGTDATRPLFKISLAEWSLHRTLRAKNAKMTNLDFPAVAKKDYGIDAVEYVNQFFKDKARDEKYLKELKKRCSDNGVTSVLIMCDGEGNLGDPDDKKRKAAVENHHKWVEAAKFLGCHSIRVNAYSRGSYDEQLKLAADGLRQLCEYGDKHAINVIVENHGGLSSNGAWLAAVMKKVDHKRAGTLPDFGNFRISGPTRDNPNAKVESYDSYAGVAEMMPMARGVSVKPRVWDSSGNNIDIDLAKMMKIVVDAGYRGHCGIEYGPEGNELDGVKKLREQLEAVRVQLSEKSKP